MPIRSKNGQDVRVQIISKLADPDAFGSEWLVVGNARFNDLTLHPSVRRFEQINEVMRLGYFTKIYSEDLPHRAKQDRSNKDGQCYPAIGTIARELQLSRRMVERAIVGLIQAGLLEKEQRWHENGGRSSLLYTLKKV